MASREAGVLDAVVVGAGFAGLYAVHKLRDELGLTTVGVEAGGDVGGTWYWNRYPGCRCDIESYSYSYSFSDELQQEWEWTERFAGQPEILRYLNHVADRFDLRRSVRFDTRIIAASWDGDNARWDVSTDSGELLRTRFLVSAAGCLSAAKDPELPALESFAGRLLSTARWPHEPVDFGGRRVGIVGTGSTGIQLIPHLARQAAHVTVFQRTPQYATPLGNGPMDPELQRLIKVDYAAFRERSRNHLAGIPYEMVRPSACEVSDEERHETFAERCRQGGFRMFFDSYSDILFDQAANDTAADFVREMIRRRVSDDRVAEMLCPKDYPYGTKRPPLETDYYEAFNSGEVTLVDLQSTPIERVEPSGLGVEGGAVHELDDLVLATGFDAMTGPLLRMNITGRDGVDLGDRWSEGPRTFLGLAVHGFPNLFTITGPQSPSVLYNMPLAIEDHVDWIADCIGHMREHRLNTIEPTLESEGRWVQETTAIADQTLLATANSWYTGANVPGKPRVFMVYLGGAPEYRRICGEVAANGYAGFVFDGTPLSVEGRSLYSTAPSA